MHPRRPRNPPAWQRWVEQQLQVERVDNMRQWFHLQRLDVSRPWNGEIIYPGTGPSTTTTSTTTAEPCLCSAASIPPVTVNLGPYGEVTLGGIEMGPWGEVPFGATYTSGCAQQDMWHFTGGITCGPYRCAEYSNCPPTEQDVLGDAHQGCTPNRRCVCGPVTVFWMDDGAFYRTGAGCNCDLSEGGGTLSIGAFDPCSGAGVLLGTATYRGTGCGSAALVSATWRGLAANTPLSNWPSTISLREVPCDDPPPTTTTTTSTSTTSTTTGSHCESSGCRFVWAGGEWVLSDNGCETGSPDDECLCPTPSPLSPPYPPDWSYYESFACIQNSALTTTTTTTTTTSTTTTSTTTTSTTTAGPTTTTTTTSTTTSACNVNDCLYFWDGVEWDFYASYCGLGCQCGPPPSTPGILYGHVEFVECEPA